MGFVDLFSAHMLTACSEAEDCTFLSALHAALQLPIRVLMQALCTCS